MQWLTTSHPSIDDIPAAEWDALDLQSDLFVSHAFLSAAEKHGAAAAEMGWHPMHITVRDDAGALIGALPLYLKTHSFGDFSQDWQWANAYDRVGLDYYPKLVSCIPYTPANGPRFLVGRDLAREPVVAHLIKAAVDCAVQLKCAAWQCLFLEERDVDTLKQEGLLLRRGCQFHWSNRAYKNFDEFLATFSSDKRKKVKRERRQVAESGLTIEVRHGDEIDDALWQTIHSLYKTTFDKYGNHAAFSLDFFKDVAQQTKRGVVVFLAREKADGAENGVAENLSAGNVVAAAICYRSESTLYGRHWGAAGDYPGLHFELCYYQGIDYCIQNGLQRFEPGAQGEYKVSRGFTPTSTWSAHWIAHPKMRNAIGDFLEREDEHIEIYQDEMASHAPYKVGL